MTIEAIRYFAQRAQSISGKGITVLSQNYETCQWVIAPIIMQRFANVHQ